MMREGREVFGKSIGTAYVRFLFIRQRLFSRFLVPYRNMGVSRIATGLTRYTGLAVDQSKWVSCQSVCMGSSPVACSRQIRRSKGFSHPSRLIGFGEVFSCSLWDHERSLKRRRTRNAISIKRLIDCQLEVWRHRRFVMGV
jgi:hypothetical protein